MRCHGIKSRNKYKINETKLKVVTEKQLILKSKIPTVESFSLPIFMTVGLHRQTNCYCSVSVLFKYLQVGDLKGAVFHQADSTVISQNPLAVFLPLDARGGVSHDVTV